MNTTELSSALAEIFATLHRPFAAVAYALEGDEKFKPPTAVIRKVLLDFAREAGKGSHGYQIGKAFDENPGYVKDLALVVAASYSGPG